MEVDTLFAQPQHPASAVKVRSFAERALQEIRSKEGSHVVTIEKTVFEEFMHKVTESVLMGRDDPPTIASVANEQDAQKDESIPCLDPAGDSDAFEGQAVQGGYSKTKKNGGAEQEWDVLMRQGRKIGGKICTANQPRTEMIDGERTIHNMFKDCGSTSAIRTANTDVHLVDRSSEGHGVLEELRRWRHQALQGDYSRISTRYTQVNGQTPTGHSHARRAAKMNPSSSRPSMCPRAGEAAAKLPKMGVVASCGKTRGLREREANAGATNVVTCRGEVPDNAAAISAIIGREGKRQDDTEGPSEGAGSCCNPRPPPRLELPGNMHGAEQRSPDGRAPRDTADLTSRARESSHDRRSGDVNPFLLDGPRSISGSVSGNSQDERAPNCGLANARDVARPVQEECSSPTDSFAMVGEKARGSGREEEENPLDNSLDLSDCSDEKLGRTLESGPRRKSLPGT